MSRNRIVVGGAVGLVLVASASFSAIMTKSRGTWPESWPESLEPLREQARTIGVHTGAQEMIYQIPFHSRDEFERAWPHILEVKSPGGVLILDDRPSRYPGETMGPGVRLICPLSGTSTSTDRNGNTLEWTWPPEEVDPTYEPPEYVIHGGGAWVPYTPSEEFTSFLFRARVDVMLVVDGDIVDLNRIRFPADTRILDRRFESTVIDSDGGS